MNKTTMLILSAFMLTSTMAYCADIKLEQLRPEEMSYSQRQIYQQQQQQTAQDASNFEKDPVYYPNATVNTAIAKYKKGNYTGCIQEMYSIIKKDPSNAVAYYYIALCYTQIGDNTNAVKSYEKVIALNPNQTLLNYATKGRDCITGGPACSPEGEHDELDTFVNSPYGNGLSPELSVEMKQKQLERVKQTINTKEELNKKDIEKIRKIDSKSEAKQTEKLAYAEPTSDEILSAIDVLKRAGVNVSLQNASSQNENSYMNMMNPMAAYSDPQMAEMSMLLGNNNNNNNNAMWNMLPFMLANKEQGKNIDPQVIQAMMMQSMLPNLDFNSGNNNNRY